ncbi:MAG: ABC transporter ATP-binding protein [Candidatus Adiutrix sp.]|jgi:ABC-2 type transport system ATP-binding protein|nr:ABC transporter ATP-binding protein [Candidatus Adiutrix sp.]
MIEIINLTKRYQHHTAVDDLSLRVAPGEIFGFLGPNGAGKTTTIRMVAGALAPTSGEIILGGHHLARAPRPAKSLVGYIPDRPFLYEKLSGWEFFEFLADLYQVARPALADRGPKLLELFELSDWCHDLIENYSHGMKQRLIMAGALLPRPRILVVDEPIVGLDPRGAKLVVDIFRHLADQEGVAILVSTHTMSLASRLCHRIGIIFKGRLEAVGTEDELRARSGQDGDLEDIFLKITDGGAPQILSELFTDHD